MTESAISILGMFYFSPLYPNCWHLLADKVLRAALAMVYFAR
ncbi:hypothetical protein [Shewanella morhuae]|nr:hypothetical protein [Shewanella morhuae]